jgi:hypothetical protein
MVLPPQVDIILKSSKGIENLSAERAKAESELTQLVANELSSRGFKVQFAQNQENATEQPTNTNLAMSMCEQVTDGMYGKVSKLPETEAHNYHFTLGTNTAALTKNSGAGSVVFVRLRIWKRSAGDNAAETGTKTLIGLATLGFVVPAKSPSGAIVLQMALVDGPTGDVLWGNEVSHLSFTLAGSPDYANKLKGFVADLFKPMPQF